MISIFVLGATGHIGGAVLDLLITSYPKISINTLVRTSELGHELVARYPNVTTIVGDLNSYAVLESMSTDADIVINCAPDISHEAGISAILTGLSKKSKKGYYIHLSGASLIWDEPSGSAATKVWDDIIDIETLTSISDRNTHRKTDKLVFEASQQINVAIISPPTVYGLSPSLNHPFPLTVPSLLNIIRLLDSGFTIASGQNLQSFIHVIDLAHLFLALVSNALGALSSLSLSEVDPNIWGPKAYYFAASQELQFVELMRAWVSVLKKKGVLNNENIRSVNFEELVAESMKEDTGEQRIPEDWVRKVTMSFGVNTRIRSMRAERLGWVPKEERVEEGLDEVLGRYLEVERRGWG